MSQYNNIQSVHQYMVSYHEPKCTLDTKLPSVLQFLHPHASIRPAHLWHSGSIFCAHGSTRNYFMSIKASKSSNCQSPKINGPYSRSAHFRTRFFKLLCLKKIALSMLRKLPSKKKKKTAVVFLVVLHHQSVVIDFKAQNILSTWLIFHWNIDGNLLFIYIQIFTVCFRTVQATIQLYKNCV